MPGADASGVPQAGPPDDGRSVAAAGMETSWRTERQQLKPGQTTRQSSDSQLADRPPDSPHRHAGSCRASGRPRPPGSSAPGRRIQGRGRAAGAGRAGGIAGLDAGGGPVPAAAVARCRCPLRQSAAGRIAASVGRSRGAGPRSGSMPTPERSAAAMCSAASFTRITPSQPDDPPGSHQQALVGGDDRLPHSPTRAGRRRRGRHLRPIPAESTPAAAAEPRMTTDPGLAKLRPGRVG